MWGPAYEPKFPTRIAATLKIVGSLFIVWSIVNWVIAHTPFQTTLSAAVSVDVYGSLLRSMGILYLIIGIAFILNGVAITKIIEATKYEIERASK